MKTLASAFVLVNFVFFAFNSNACAPCDALSNISTTINGTNLELNFSNNAGWNCCYTVDIEIICASGTFTGIPNYTSAEICLNGGNGPSTTNTLVTPYPTLIIDISGWCPGVYSWRGIEPACGIYTPVQTFTVVGTPSPIIINASAVDELICDGESTQFTSSATNGCAGGPYTYSWSPVVGLSDPTIPNPIVTPLSTTTYTLTVSEIGTCAATQTAAVTINVNAPPTATISGTTGVCLNASPAVVTFTGAGGTSPYTINYTLNGIAQTPITTTGSSGTVQTPTSPTGTYVYALTNITESSVAQCSQNQAGVATITVNPLPIVDAGQDQVVCEPNSNSPSDVTLNGSGAVSYTWDNGVTNGVAFTPPSGTTIFTVTGTDANGCTNSDVVSVTAILVPIANGTANDYFGNAPITVDFTNLSLYASNYSWDFGDGNFQATTSLGTSTNTFMEPGIYEVLLTASNGICYDTMTILIEVVPPMIVTPPNVFTPNGDQTNDDYFVDVQYGSAFEALVLNRWGNEVTTFTHLNQGWNGKSNGKDMEEGVYFIKYIATDHNGGIIEGHTYFKLLR